MGKDKRIPVCKKKKKNNKKNKTKANNTARIYVLCMYYVNNRIFPLGYNCIHSLDRVISAPRLVNWTTVHAYNTCNGEDSKQGPKCDQLYTGDQQKHQHKLLTETSLLHAEEHGAKTLTGLNMHLHLLFPTQVKASDQLTDWLAGVYLITLTDHVNLPNKVRLLVRLTCFNAFRFAQLRLEIRVTTCACSDQYSSIK